MTRSRNISTTSQIREAACALACALVLCGCSSESDTSWSDIYQAAKMSFSSGTSSISLKQAAAVPYASIGVRLGDGQEQMLVLASATQEGELWTSTARVAFLMRDGRIVRTSGLTRNLSGVVFTGNDPLTTFRAPGASPRDSTRQIDFWSMNMFSVALRCRMVSRGDDPVTILGSRIATHRIEENCKSDRLDWSFTNTFWMDASGLIWKSVQYIHPDLDPVQTEILRPPSH